jgi:hypothetical protein
VNQVVETVSQAQEKAQEKAQPAIGQAQDRVRSEVDRRSTQAGEQLSSMAQVMRRTGEDLRSQGNDPHGKVADAAAERMDQVGGYLQRADADTILSDLEDLARRQPLVVVAGGLVLGLAAARFLKASGDRRYEASIDRRYQTSIDRSYDTTIDRSYDTAIGRGYETPVDRRYDPYGTRPSGA